LADTADKAFTRARIDFKQMKLPFLSLLLLFSLSAMAQQRHSNWQRVYTFEDSAIEMNTRRFVITPDGIGLVTFRWSFDQPQAYSFNPQIKYKTRVERIAFKCSENKFRTYDIEFLNNAGRVVRNESNSWSEEWRGINSSVVMSTLGESACALISPPKVKSKLESTEFRKVLILAGAFVLDLERAKDFRAVEKYFRPHYIDGYLKDKSTRWFTNLESDLAAKSSRSDLERYYLAQMNTTYLGILYFGTGEHRLFTDTNNNQPPPALLDLVKRHPYSIRFRKSENDFDYFADKIDSIEKLRSYTDLLQQINNYFLRELNSRPRALRQIFRKKFEGWETRGAEAIVCSKECLGLPKGTRLWEIDIPIFHLQIARLNGRMQIVSAVPSLY
jgi:hypothetical protein